MIRYEVESPNGRLGLFVGGYDTRRWPKHWDDEYWSLEHTVPEPPMDQIPQDCFFVFLSDPAIGSDLETYLLYKIEAALYPVVECRIDPETVEIVWTDGVQAAVRK